MVPFGMNSLNARKARPRQSRKFHLVPVGSMSLQLEAELFDHRVPLALLADDVGGVLLGRAGGRAAAVGDDAFLELIRGHDGAQLLVEPLDDRPRRAGWRGE